MSTVRERVAHWVTRRMRPYCEQIGQVLRSWFRRARPLLLAAAVVGAIVLLAESGTGDRFRHSPIEKSPSHTAEPGGGALPWGVQLPTLPASEQEVREPRIGFRDLPELAEAPPREPPTSGGGVTRVPHSGPAGAITSAVWIVFGAAVAAAVVAAVAAAVRRRGQSSRDSDDEAINAWLEDPEQNEYAAAEGQHQERPALQVASPAATATSRTSPTPTASGRPSNDVTDHQSASDSSQAEPTSPSPGKQGRPHPVRGDRNSTAPPSAAPDRVPTRGEDTSSRVVLFERGPGAWGR